MTIILIKKIREQDTTSDPCRTNKCCRDRNAVNNTIKSGISEICTIDSDSCGWVTPKWINIV